MSSQSIFPQIVKHLESKGISFQVLEHQEVYTSAEAATVRETKISQAAKALVMVADSSPILLVLPGHLKADLAKVKKQFKIRDLRMATAEEVFKWTQTKVGAVSPFGILFGIPTYLDSNLSQNAEVVFSAGEHTKSIRMKYTDLLLAIEPILSEFAKIEGHEDAKNQTNS